MGKKVSGPFSPPTQTITLVLMAAGGIIGIAALVLMLLTLPYVAAKHIAWVDKVLSRLVSKPTLLAIHIYAGVLAPILGLVHAAHKLESPVGLLLTVLLLMTVITGFIGRYLLAQLGRALRGRRSELASLRAAFLEEPAAPTQAVAITACWSAHSSAASRSKSRSGHSRPSLGTAVPAVVAAASARSSCASSATSIAAAALQ